MNHVVAVAMLISSSAFAMINRSDHCGSAHDGDTWCESGGGAGGWAGGSGISGGWTGGDAVGVMPGGISSEARTDATSKKEKKPRTWGTIHVPGGVKVDVNGGEIIKDGIDIVKETAKEIIKEVKEFTRPDRPVQPKKPAKAPTKPKKK